MSGKPTSVGTMLMGIFVVIIVIVILGNMLL